MTERAYNEKTGYSYEYVNSKGYKYYPGDSDEFEYYVENYIASISGYKFSNDYVEIPCEINGYTVNQVAENAFKNNSFIKTVVFNENIRNINDYAFYGCSALSSVSFPKSLRKISDYAFASCKSLLSVSLTNVVVVSPTAFDSTTKINIEQTDFIRNALDYVDGMTAGWNLGNTLDAHSGNYGYGDLTVTQSEQLWRHYNYISQDLFNMVVEKFNTIRIPITWNAFINPNDNYNIDKDFMDRIQEIVDMCYDAGFEYIIINTHHDSDYYFNVNPENDQERAKYVLKRVWEQIGERFEDYDEKLIFEPMNEIRSIPLDYSTNGDWYGQTQELHDNFNNLNKVFVETVRSSGGNNPQRYLMLQTYAGVRDSHQVSKQWIPSVEEDNHIIASVHWYIETTNIERDYVNKINSFKNRWMNNGIPCVIGEIGLPAYYDTSGNITVYNDDQREIWGNTAFGYFEQTYGLKAIIWEDHGNYSTVRLNNGVYSWKFPKYIAAIKAQTQKGGNSGETTPVNLIIDGVQVSTSEDGTIILPTSSATGFVCYTDGTNYYQENQTVKATEDLNLTSVSVGSVSMLEGASMRLNNSTGLRYYTKVDAEKIATLRAMGATVKMGTLIAPEDLLGDTPLTFEDAKVYAPGVTDYNCMEVKYNATEYFQGGNTFVGTISNIKEGNTNRQFIGRGYVTVTLGDITKTFYGSYSNNDISNHKRSIGYIAYHLQSDNAIYDSYDDDKKSIIDYYAQRYQAS